MMRAFKYRIYRAEEGAVSVFRQLKADIVAGAGKSEGVDCRL